jgi:uncharacterized UPF0160 family protein
MEPEAKRMKPTKTIGTHDGTFHCDEAMACFLLKSTDEFKDAEIFRTRDPKVLEKMDILVDVGAVYDPSKHRYDHHQREFTGTFGDNYKIKLSSAGLVYKHFGKEVVAKILNTDEATTNIIYQQVYDKLILALDGIDNGVNQYETDSPPLYVNNTDLGARVGKLNPAWNQPAANRDELFKRAMEIAGAEFTETVKYFGQVWWPARHIVKEAIEKRNEVDPSGKIIVLSQFCPWKDHLFDLEKEFGIQGQVIYILFGDTSGGWRVQAAPKNETGFDSRKTLPAAWCGLRDDVLSTAINIPNCIFVHANGFIGGNKTYEGALAMAKAALTIE